jgi:hypothetical protein
MPNPPTAYQPRSKLKRVFLLVGGLVLLAALLGGYYAYWRYVARQLEAGVAAWAEQQRALGNEVAFQWDGIGGFPFLFTATFRNPAIRWHTPQPEMAWQGATVDAEMAPWDLREIRIRSDGAQDAIVHLTGDASGWHLATTGFVGVVNVYATGALRALTVALQQPDLTQPDGAALASGKATVTLDLPEAPPTDFKAPLARVAVELERTPVPVGVRLLTQDPVQLLAFDATIKGPMPLAPLREALASWRDAGGVADVSRFNFVQGPLGLSGSATLALDPDLQPEGAGTVTAAGLGDAVEILIRDGLIPPDRALAARATVRALEKPGPTGKPQATIGLSVQNRTVSFGPVPLFALQRIEWP